VRFLSGPGGLRAADLDVRVIARGADGYPGPLEHLPDPPDRLWVVGRDLASLPPCVAIVGSRTPTHYGQEIAHGLAADLAARDICVVSGLARGIDSFAHRGALEGGTTVAVLAGGIDRCHPASNRELYEQIAEEGALLAEVPPGTPNHKRRFTHRNRIIAALSLAVVVVQAGERSGALATARHALGIGRDVFAVPGDIRVEVSAGCHELLRDGATPCTSANDVLQRIEPELARASADRVFVDPPDDMPEPHRAMLSLLGGEAMSSELLGRDAGLAGGALAVALIRLEIAGWIARGPGGSVRRVR
jgi:DNA processing protein